MSVLMEILVTSATVEVEIAFSQKPEELPRDPAMLFLGTHLKWSRPASHGDTYTPVEALFLVDRLGISLASCHQTSGQGNSESSALRSFPSAIE